MAAFLATAAYAACGIYAAIVRPLRKKKRKPVYVIKNGKIYPA
jgi:hypothetical protein